MSDPNASTSDNQRPFGTSLDLYLHEPVSPRYFREIGEAALHTVEVVANCETHMQGTPREV